MLVEPPRPLVPARAGLTIAAGAPLRTAAAVAALVLAVLSRGDVVVLAALLACAAWHPPALGAVVPALLASAWRWGSTSLDALAGAQAVLGPAGWTGTAAAAASSWLAAVALVLAVPGRLRPPPIEVGGMGGPHGALDAPNLVLAGATGAAAAVVVAGPAVGGAVWVRVLATVVATALALVVTAWRTPRRATLVDGVAIAAGLGALVLAGLDAPALSGTLDGAALRTGAAVAVAVTGVAVVGERAVTAMRRQRV